MSTAWPGEDIVYTHRPKNRPRHGSEALVNNRTIIVDGNRLLNPDVLNNQSQHRRRRSSSASSQQQQQPTQIIINNDNGANARNQQYHDEHDEHVEQRRLSPPLQQQQQQHHRRRPSSVYVDDRGYSMVRVRSSSRARRTPPLDLEDEYEYRFVDDIDERRVGRQVVHVGGGRRSRTPSWERRRREHEEAERRRKEEEDRRHKDDEERRKAYEDRRKADEERLKAEEERLKRRAEDDAKLKELAAIKKKQADEEERKRIEKELHLKKLEEEKAKADRDAVDKKLKAAAIEEYKIKMAEEEAKHRREQEEQEDKMVTLLMAGNPGMSERDARKFIRRAEKAKERGGRAPSEEREEPGTGLVALKAKPRPTYIKVHSKHLSPETLDVYSLPWEWESSDSDYIIIKQWISDEEQEILFTHTRQLRERARLTYPRDKLRNDASQLVIPKEDKKRKKSPIKRTSWFLT